MPSGMLKVEDVPITRGMNTVDEARDLRPGECRNLVNGIPGETVVARPGCDGVLLRSSSTWRFLPPGMLLDTVLGRNIIAIVMDEATQQYKLISFPEDTDGTDHTVIGYGTMLKVPPLGSNFGMAKAYDTIIVSPDAEWLSWLGAAHALGHKVVEADGLTVRDLCIDVAPAVVSVAQVVTQGGPFNGGGTGQAFTVNSATDVCTCTAHGYSTGDPLIPSNVGGFLPTPLAQDTEVYAIRIDANTFYVASSYANALLGIRIDLTDNGAGTHSIIETSDCFAYAFTYVRRSDDIAFDPYGSVSGMIMPAGITGTPKEVATPIPPATESITDTDNDKTIAITANGCGINIDIGAASVHTAALAKGATHIRIYRTRRFRTTVLAANATKLFVMDAPIKTGGHTALDLVSDAALEGEFTQLTMQDYASAPIGQHTEFAKGRFWVFVDGRGYYSETPGGDGGAPSADSFAYPQKWAAMFKPAEYYVDCEYRDGQESRGITLMGDDLYFFKESKLYALLSADPSLAVVTEISAAIGCAFPHTITVCEVKGYFGKCILFMSNKGPMVIQQGGQLRPLAEFKVRELWGGLSEELYGELDPVSGHPDFIRQNCSAAFVDDTWYVFYQTYTGIYRCFAMYFSENLAVDSNAARGAYEVVFANIA